MAEQTGQQTLDHLYAYRAALQSALLITVPTGKSHSALSQSMTNHDLSTLNSELKKTNKEIDFWENQKRGGAADNPFMVTANSRD